MGKKSTPSAPDPVQTAAAQTASNKETAVANANLNRINQYTPQGSLVYEKIGVNEDGTPQYKVTESYSPEQQGLYESGTRAAQEYVNIANTQLDQVKNALSTPISYENAPALMNAADAATQAKAEEAYMSRINPQLERDRAALEARLASQGLALNSEAYNKAMDVSNRQSNDARQQAILASLQQAQQMAALNNAARQQSIQETTSLRSQPLNEISALLSGSQVTNPQFAAVPQVNMANTDVITPTYASYNANLSNANQGNSTLGGLFGLGSSALGGWGMSGFNKFW